MKRHFRMTFDRDAASAPRCGKLDRRNPRAEKVRSKRNNHVGPIQQIMRKNPRAVRFLVRGVLRLFGVEVDPDSHVLAVREEIVGALQLGHSEGVVEKEDRDRILGALDLGDRTVEEIMLHRSGIEMIDAATDPANILRQSLESRHTRLPVFDGEPENIIGVVHAKDLLRAMHRLIDPKTGSVTGLTKFDIRQVAMKPYFVPETTTLDDQMRNFLHRRTHFALVVDEYGTLQGLITLEDILEEIVGDIEDEFDDDEETDIRKLSKHTFAVRALTTIEEFNATFGTNFSDEEVDTVGGMVMTAFGHLPSRGELVEIEGYNFKVTAADNRRVIQLQVTIPDEETLVEAAQE